MYKTRIATFLSGVTLFGALTLNAAADTFTYDGVVTDGLEPFLTVVPVGSTVAGPIEVKGTAVSAGTAGPTDITSIGVLAYNQCFYYGNGACGGFQVPITAIDLGAMTFADSRSSGGTLEFTAYSSQFSVYFSVVFDFTAGTFLASHPVYGAVSGIGVLTPNAAQANTEPTANAGADQSIRAGDTVFLNGGASFDDNTAPGALLYAWSFSLQPEGSTATLTGGNTATPSFVADVQGTYVVDLVVTDEGGLDSATDQVEISSDNLAPTADAGDDQLVIVGTTVFLDGVGSSDPEEDTLTYSWSLTAPSGSNAALSGSTTVNPTFISDVEGQYLVELQVSDALGPGLPDSTIVTAADAGDYAEVQVVETAEVVDALTVEEITTAGNQQAFSNFLSQAIQAAQGGDTAEATKKLEDAIKRTDGCVLRGEPDGKGKNRDWITDCNAQVDAYALLTDALNAIRP